VYKTKLFCEKAKGPAFPPSLLLELISQKHFRLRRNIPQGLKPTIFAASGGTAPSASLGTGSAVPYPKTDS
jgi:hypothetical protein